MHSRKILPAAVLAATAAVGAVGTAGTAEAATTAGAIAIATAAQPHTLPVQVVRPGQIVDAGHGEDLKLTATDLCVGTPELWWTCKSVVDGNQPPGTVSVQYSGDASGTFYSPLYIGSGKAARMTLTTGGVTYEVQVVTLAGHPGYATGYAWGAPGNDDIPSITVYNAAGTVLAHS
jgi:hypothetical protein